MSHTHDRSDAVVTVVPTETLIQHEYLTIEELATLMRVHSNSVRNAIKYNGLPAFRIGSGKAGAYRIARTAFLEWQKKQATQIPGRDRVR